MASSVVGALRVVLGLDSAEFTSGINRANRATGQFAKQGKTFETATRGMSTALRGLTAALGIIDRKTKRLNPRHYCATTMPPSACNNKYNTTHSINSHTT